MQVYEYFLLGYFVNMMKLGFNNFCKNKELKIFVISLFFHLYDFFKKQTLFFTF